MIQHKKSSHDFQWLGLFQDAPLSPEEEAILNDNRFEAMLIDSAKNDMLSVSEAKRISMAILNRQYSVPASCRSVVRVTHNASSQMGM